METGNHSTFSAPRRARPEEARTIANLWLRSRYASIPAIPAPVHTDDETREWWCAAEYLCQSVDNFRIWAERLAAAGQGAHVVLVPYDADALADARVYRNVPLEG